MKSLIWSGTFRLLKIINIWSRYPKTCLRIGKKKNEARKKMVKKKKEAVVNVKTFFFFLQMYSVTSEHYFVFDVFLGLFLFLFSVSCSFPLKQKKMYFNLRTRRQEFFFFFLPFDWSRLRWKTKNRNRTLAVIIKQSRVFLQFINRNIGKCKKSFFFFFSFITPIRASRGEQNRGRGVRC